MLNPAEFEQVKHVIFVQAKKLSKGDTFLEEELVSEGFLGLAEGIRTHNPERSALKTWCISMSKWAQFEYLSLYIAEVNKNRKSKPNIEIAFECSEASEISERKIALELAGLIKTDNTTAVHISIFKDFLEGATRKELAKKYDYTTAGVSYCIQNIVTKIKELL